MEEKIIVTSCVGDRHWSARLVGEPASEVGVTEDEAYREVNPIMARTF